MKVELDTNQVGIGKTVSLPVAAAIERAEACLKEEGFGILTRIDVRATMKEKLGIDVPPCVILGACNPALAHRALEAEPQVSLLMPCNVVVREESGGKVRVEAMNAGMISTLFPEADLSAMAREATERLTRAIRAI